MIQFFSRKLALVIVAFCLSFLFYYEPAFATTYSFQSPGTPGQEGVLTGSVIYNPDTVRKSIENIPPNRGLAGGLKLNELGGDGKFSFEYVSPYSGVKHSEDTICSRNIYDVNSGLPGDEVIGDKEGPFFDFSDTFDLISIDFRSCVGKKGDVNSSISDRDPLLAFSELESQFNQLKLVEEDYSGSKPGRFKKRLPIKVKLEKR